jgi:hypothetical protein
MKQYKYILGLAAAFTLFAASCQQSGSGQDEAAQQNKDTATAAPPQASIIVAPVSQSPEFPNATLGIASVTSRPNGDSAAVTFIFSVKNYELKSQTSDGATKLCNNSKDGQHIHFIVDNRPYKALYEPKNELMLPINSEHYVLAFLSRSYHESLKNKESGQLYHFKIDEKGRLQKLENPSTPMIFYSRPKGDYLGADTENLLLDFYTVNAPLAADGYRVQAHITATGLDTTITISEWKSNFIKGLPMGKTKVTLSLIDKDGNAVGGAHTTASREFNLSKEEPMTN